MTLPVAILHLSDLHFSEPLIHTGRRLWQTAFGAKTHDFNRLDALSSKVRQLRLDEEALDLLIATGDISTDGRRESLELSRAFFENAEVKGGTPSRLLTFGLDFPPEKRIVLAGNHDRYSGLFPIQQPSAELESVFDVSGEYPYSLAFTGEGENPLTVVFFIFDSTNTNEHFRHWVGYQIARGRVNDAECDWLSVEVKRIQDGGDVRFLNGTYAPVDYQRAVKVALLHHHPVLPNGKFKANEYTVLENHHRFVTAAGEAKLNLVLFGHQHKYYVERVVHPGDYHTVTYICCPSASEYSEQANGWHYYQVHEDRCELWRFTWNGTSFVPEEPQTFAFSNPRQRGAGT